MEKQFVSYELALKLKELGFDEECFGAWKNNKETPMKGYFENQIMSSLDNAILAPLWQQAFDWLLWKLKHLSVDIIYSTAGCEVIVEKEKVNQHDTKEECLEKLIELCGNRL